MVQVKNVCPYHRPGNAGTLSGAIKDKCKCPQCRTLWNAYMRWYRSFKLGRLHKACPTCTCALPPNPTLKQGASDD